MLKVLLVSPTRLYGIALQPFDGACADISISLLDLGARTGIVIWNDGGAARYFDRMEAMSHCDY